MLQRLYKAVLKKYNKYLYKILSNIDFGRTHISVLSVENNYSDYRILKLMAQNGFEICAIVGDNDIYRNKGVHN